jgi:molybdopterin-guanine dinucleotide biosynthesis protein A
MDSVIIAGGNPKQDDLLYPLAGDVPKALLQISGKPMIQWVVDALNESKTVDRIVIVGLDSNSSIHCEKPISFIPDQGSMLDNIRGGIKEVSNISPQAEHALLLSADIPGITGEMVDWTVNTALETNHDLYYSIVTRDVMESLFPSSKRSFVRLKDIDVCGGDMNLFRISMVTGRDDLWNKLIASRKNALKQASLIGFDTLLLLLLRQLTLEQLVKTVTRRFNINGRAVLSPFAEVAMDVDKPFQFDILNTYLEQKTSG